MAAKKKKAGRRPSDKKPKAAGRAAPPKGGKKGSGRGGSSSGRKAPSGRQASPEPKKRKGSGRQSSPEPKKARRGGSKDDSGRSRAVAPAGGRGGAPAGFLKPEGMRLSVKFVLIISGMVCVVMLLSSLVIYAISVGNLEDEIQSSGAHMVSAVEGIGQSYLEYMKILDTELQPVETKIDELVGKQRNDELSQDEVRELDSLREKSAYLKGRMSAATNRYNDYLAWLITVGAGGTSAAKVLNAWTQFDNTKFKDLNPRPQSVAKRVAGTKQTFIWEGKRTSVTFAEGVLDLTGSGKSRAMLYFTKPIKVGSAEKGYARIALNMAVINDTKSGLLVNILAFTVVSILIGVGVSFILASQISRPVQKLLEDMSIVAKGRLEHQTKPMSKDEIGVLARTFNEMTKGLRAAKQLELQNQAREHDLKIATEIQANLLPSKIPEVPGFEIAAFYQPSKEVGGDYYDFIPIDDDHMAMCVADVSGKGIPGSMVMTMARSLIRMEASRNLSAADTLKKVNKVIARDIRRGMFVTALYMVVNLKKKTVLVASAGHNPMVLYRAKSKKNELVNPNGIALGFDKGPIFDRTIREEEIQLEKGDRTVIYTDGIPESMNPKNEEFGDDEFYELVRKVSPVASNKFINTVVGAVRKHQGSADQHDDITISTMSVV